MASTDLPRADLYLIKDGDRILCVAANYEGRLFCYITNFDAFIYNKPLSVDFQLDDRKQYDRISAEEASRIIREGRLGRIHDDDVTLMDWASSEQQRMRPAEVLGRAV